MKPLLKKFPSFADFGDPAPEKTTGKGDFSPFFIYTHNKWTRRTDLAAPAKRTRL